ncbi:MAG: ABC transporter substrate-binding protein, partial [Alphaproteobacteria bacterium]|nr:ABC transporter substrate-binding protein [Alphaproteobacteria bacterium]
DVAFSIDRIKTIPNSPGSLAVWVRKISKVESVDERTVRMTTVEPVPYLLWDLANVLIMNKATTTGMTTADINAGRGANGTGPYRNSSFVVNDQWVVERNPHWWGGASPWQKVTFRTLANDSTRLTTLLAGDVDLIQGVPLTNIERIASDARFTLFKKLAFQTFWLVPDAVRDTTPYAFDEAGNPLPRNPLKDVRVRRALLMAINRQAILERILNGHGEVAHQIAAPGATERGTVPEVPYDPDAARRLLTEAGYPNGFTIVLHGSTGVIPNDDQLSQAAAQFFTRIGVRARVETAPASVLFPRATRRDTSLYFSGTPTPNAATPLRTTQMTPNAERGDGTANRLHYSNPVFDQMMFKVFAEMDETKRRAMVAEATRLLMDDVPVIPLFHVAYTWAARKGINYKAAPLLMNQAILASPQ